MLVDLSMLDINLQLKICLHRHKDEIMNIVNTFVGSIRVSIMASTMTGDALLYLIRNSFILSESLNSVLNLSPFAKT